MNIPQGEQYLPRSFEKGRGKCSKHILCNFFQGKNFEFCISVICPALFKKVLGSISDLGFH